jgi:nucleolar complex protein 3
VLYFSILKSPNPLSNPQLLSAALEGIAKFAHLVNVDFFQDLMMVLKTIAHACKAHLHPSENFSIQDDHQSFPPRQQGRIAILKLQLLCIVTAFELLSGQGALTMLLSRRAFVRPLPKQKILGIDGEPPP